MKNRILQVVLLAGRALATVLAVACLAQAQAPSALHLQSSGPFGFSIPEDWRRLQGNEQEALKNAFEKQAQSLYGSYTNSSSARVPDLDVQGWLTPSGSMFMAVGMTVPLEDHLMERRAKEAQDKATYGVEHGLIKRASDVRPLRRDGYEGFEIDFDNPDGSKTFTAGLQSLKEPTQLVQLQWTPKTTETSSLEAFGRAVNSVHLLTVFGDYQLVEQRWLLRGAAVLLALLAIVGVRFAALWSAAAKSIPADASLEMETPMLVEGEARLFWRDWLKERMSWFIWPLVLLSVWALCALVLFPYEMYKSDRYHDSDIIESILGVVVFGILGTMMAGIGGVVALLICVGTILAGPPQAKRSPKKVLRQFYNKVLNPPFGKKLATLDAFVCLTHSAKSTFAGISDFASHWQIASNSLRETCGAQSLKHASVEGIEVKPGAGDRLDYSATVKFTHPQKKKVARGGLTGELVKIGGRWYIPDGKRNIADLSSLASNLTDAAPGEPKSRSSKLLQALGPKPTAEIIRLAELGDEDGVKAQLSLGVSASAVDRNKNTALHFAAFEGHGAIVKALLAGGAKSDATNKQGQTPLLLAEACHHVEVVSILSAAGGRHVETNSLTASGPVTLKKGEQIIVSLPGEVELIMVYIPHGTFWMGSPEDEPGSDDFWQGGVRRERRHRVTISKGFLIGKYPVTHAQWRAVTGASYSHPQFKGVSDDSPVETLQHNEYIRFIEKLNTVATGGGFRLPTEAEWEYACRAGCEAPRYGPLDEIAWYARNSGGVTHPVGQKQPNAWGLYDMFGNVLEHCHDLYFAYSEDPFCIDPRPKGQSEYTIRRGGSCRTTVSSDRWGEQVENLRAARRFNAYMDEKDDVIGFRLVRNVS